MCSAVGVTACFPKWHSVSTPSGRVGGRSRCSATALGVSWPSFLELLCGFCPRESETLTCPRPFLPPTSAQAGAVSQGLVGVGLGILFLPHSGSRPQIRFVLTLDECVNSDYPTRKLKHVGLHMHPASLHKPSSFFLFLLMVQFWLEMLWGSQFGRINPTTYLDVVASLSSWGTPE